MPRFQLTVACTAILATAAAGTAAAADLPEPVQAAPVVYAAPFSWNGFYIGGNAGWGWTSSSGTMTTIAGPDTFTASGNGFVGGGQAGFNWQWGALVLGMEADFQGVPGNGTLTDNGLLPLTATVKDPWFGTFRGRVGYAWDRVMFYGTAGGVYGNGTASGTSGGTTFSTSATYVTWTAGGGVEAAIWGPLSAKFEYLYVGSPSAVPSIPGVTAMSSSARTSLLRVGLNYHF